MMMKFDREALSDCFDSVSLAQEIRQQVDLGDHYIPLKEVAHGVGIWNIQEKELNSIEGALIVPEGKIEGEIILNSNQDTNRKRFTLAHEIGHFVHPLHQPDIEGRFNCSNDDIFKPYGRSKISIIEDQANEFASELLIPKNSLTPLLKLNSGINFDEIISFSEKMMVSKAFLLRKIQPHCNTPTAFIFSLNGIIRYIHSDRFPRIKVWSKQSIPHDSISVRDVPNNSFSKKIEVSPNIWLSKNLSGTLYEQLYVQENGYRITLLSIAE